MKIPEGWPTEEMLNAAASVQLLRFVNFGYLREVITAALAAAPTPPAPSRHKLDDADIKAIALDCGFKLKPQPDGLEDLNPYVYRFAREILSAMLTVEDVESLRQRLTPPAQDEPVAVIDESDDGKFADLLLEGTFLKRGTKLYTRPADDKLRKAAEALIWAYDNHEHCITEIGDLRSALEGK